ncbi:hypothetical protein Tco_0829755 [Tanacetum coccineum]
MTNKVVLIKEKLKAARDCQKSYADNRRKPLEFEVGDRVMLKVSPWKGVIRFGKKGKLAPRYVGPFEILERIGPVAYRLRLPEELNEIKVDKTLRFVKEPVEIMDREVNRLKRIKISLVKVRWNSKRGPDFTWEREDYIKSKYPQLFVEQAGELNGAKELQGEGWFEWVHGDDVAKTIFRMRNGHVEVYGYAFWVNQCTSGFHGVNEPGRKRRCRESFNKRGSGAKRKLSRCGRNQMGNESILALPEGAGDFVVYYDARSKDLEACLEKRRRLWVVEGLTLERCSTFGKKDKLEPSYVGPFEILGWIGPIVRLKIYVLWAEYRKLDWEFLFDELRVKVRWDSKRGPELTWERKDQMRSRELKRNGNVMVVNCWNSKCNFELTWV